MGRRRIAEIPAQVDELRARIEDWRRTRTGRSRMPVTLWDAAVGLARAHGIYAVARRLRLDYTSLKCRVAATTPGSARSQRPEAGFVELRPALVASAATSIELANASGEKLTIHLGGRGDLDVIGLAAAFWRQRA